MKKMTSNGLMRWSSGLTKKAEPPPTRDVNRDGGTANANGGWLRRLVRPFVVHSYVSQSISQPIQATYSAMPPAWQKHDPVIWVVMLSLVQNHSMPR